MVFSIFELWILRLPLAYGLLLWTDLGVHGVWWAVALSYFVATIVTAAWFMRGTWLQEVIDEPETDAKATVGQSVERTEGTEEPTTND